MAFGRILGSRRLAIATGFTLIFGALMLYGGRSNSQPEPAKSDESLGRFSPEGRIDVETKGGELWVFLRSDPTQRVLLCSSSSITGLVSPDQQRIAANAHFSTTDGILYIYKRDTQTGEFKLEKLPKLGAQELIEHHVGDKLTYTSGHTRAILWSDDSKALLCTFGGHATPATVTQFAFVYDFEAGKSTEDLSVFNRGGIVPVKLREGE